MKQLIGSSNLFVMQVEMDVYTALKKVFMQYDTCEHISSTLHVIGKNWKHLVSSDKEMALSVRKVKGNMPKC